VNRASTQTPPMMAKAFTETLLGDASWTTPKGTPVYSYFCTMSIADAYEEFGELLELAHWKRVREIIKRLGEDGTPT
jgi:hypothetical protein